MTSSSLITTGGVGMLLSQFTMKSLNVVEHILPKIMIANFHENYSVSVNSSDSPTNLSKSCVRLLQRTISFCESRS